MVGLYPIEALHDFSDYDAIVLMPDLMLLDPLALVGAEPAKTIIMNSRLIPTSHVKISLKNRSLNGGK